MDTLIERKKRFTCLLYTSQIEDYIQLSQSFKRVYADKDVFWTHEQLSLIHISKCTFWRRIPAWMVK